MTSAQYRSRLAAKNAIDASERAAELTGAFASRYIIDTPPGFAGCTSDTQILDAELRAEEASQVAQARVRAETATRIGEAVAKVHATRAAANPPPDFWLEAANEQRLRNGQIALAPAQASSWSQPKAVDATSGPSAQAAEEAVRAWKWSAKTATVDASPSSSSSLARCLLSPTQASPLSEPEAVDTGDPFAVMSGMGGNKCTRSL